MRMLSFLILAMCMGCRMDIETWDDFLEEYAHAKCLVYKKCYRAHYEGEYENYATCKEDVMEAHQQEKEEEYSECIFSEEKARECLEETTTSSCGTHWSEQASIFKACHEDIWICNAP